MSRSSGNRSYSGVRILVAKAVAVVVVIVLVFEVAVILSVVAVWY